MKDKLDLLIEILLDNNAREDERHDAVLDLGSYNDDRALNALILVASKENEIDIIQDSCGDSIAEIWTKRNLFDLESFKKLSGLAQDSIIIRMNHLITDLKKITEPYIKK